MKSIVGRRFAIGIRALTFIHARRGYAKFINLQTYCLKLHYEFIYRFTVITLMIRK